MVTGSVHEITPYRVVNKEVDPELDTPASEVEERHLLTTNEVAVVHALNVDPQELPVKAIHRLAVELQDERLHPAA